MITDSVDVLPVVSSTCNSMAYGGLGLGAARQFPQSFWRFLIIPFCLLLSMFAHFLWNAGSGLIVAEYTTTGWSSMMGTVWATVFIQLPLVLLLIFWYPFDRGRLDKKDYF